MPDCEKYFDLISAYIDGELTASEEAELQTHLASCSHCRAVYDALAGLSGELRSDLEEPPEDLAANVMSAVRAQCGYPLAGAAKEQKKRRTVIFRRTALAAACVALVILAVPTLSKFGRMGSAGSTNNSAPAPASLSASMYSAKSDEAYPEEAPMMTAMYDGAQDDSAVYESEPASNGAESSGMKSEQPAAAEEPADSASPDAGYYRNWDDVQSGMDGGYDLVITVRGGVPDRFDGIIFYDGGGDVASYAVISLEEAEALASGLDAGDGVEIKRFDAGTGLALVLVK
ncbi:MAG: zf-HC2 domain-containing protein [Oscillospiraceae bacterium]|nr:zf-HC2 domain-containing protein [Oscillospiraceae bacterium]